MFEEICLVCGKHLQDDGRAYCSDDCQTTDLASPSISSSSSALSSPQLLGYTQNLTEVPALVPSALGSALRKYQGREPYCVNPPASVSNSWALDDDDDEPIGPYARPSEYGLHNNIDSIYDGSSKSANYIYTMMPSALSYARRPSGTNTHSTVPQVHQRNSSASSPAPHNRASDRGPSRSAPNHSHSSSDEEDFSDYLSSRDIADDAESERGYSFSSQSSAAKSSRQRNRASLPACFSLLRIHTSGSPHNAVKTSPISSSSAKTVARPSPPTPKHIKTDAISRWQFPRPPSNLVTDPPRGRRRNADDSRSSRPSESSPSRSPSRQVQRTASPRVGANPRPIQYDTEGSVEQVFNWNAADLPRGRTSVRRNSSPPPRMFMGVEDPGKAMRDYERSQSNSKSRSSRGRVGVEELSGVGTFALAPGYGKGRSGLIDRERFAAQRVPL